MEVDSSLGDPSNMKHHNRSLDIGHGRGEMMTAYPIGIVNAIPNYQFLAYMKKWCIKQIHTTE